MKNEELEWKQPKTAPERILQRILQMSPDGIVLVAARLAAARAAPERGGRATNGLVRLRCAERIAATRSALRRA